MRRIKVNDNARFLIYEDGRPFFWLADTAWEIFHRLTREEADYYLENRRQKGFSVIQSVALGEFDGLKIPNAYGEIPFFDQDPARPNEAYFKHVDFIIRRAAEKGLYIGLLPTWGDKVNKAWGAGPVIFNETTARAYGEWIGMRYRDDTNVLWIIGGDRPETTDGVNFVPVWRAMAEGIEKATQGNAFFTYHPAGGRSSAMELHQESWLHMNMWQSGHKMPDVPIWEGITADYQRVPTKPVLDGEPNYEDHPIDPFTRKWFADYGRFRDHDVRKQSYRSVFAGACGITYGHHSVWQFYTLERRPVNFPQPDWVTALDRPGASQMIHLRRLLESRPYLTRIPDQSLLISEPNTGGFHGQATRDADCTYAMIYVPTADQTVRIDLKKLRTAVIRATWYDPRTGLSTPIARIHDATIGEFTTPLSGPDWVLLLDAE